MSATEFSVLITCALMAAGYFVGKIKIGGISLGFAAVLIISIAFGAICANGNWAIDFFEGLQKIEIFSKFGSALFMAAIGASAGITFKNQFEWNYLFYFLFGALMTIIGFASMNIIGFLDPEFDRSLLLGVLCGALTSTPGLAAVMEQKGIDAQQATVGYGYAYLFGVVLVVLFVQLFHKKKNASLLDSKQNSKVLYPTIYGWIQLMIIMALGVALAKVKIPFLNASAGISCSVLCVGIVFGFFTKKQAKIGDLSLFRTMGLLLFFVGTGISTGLKLNGFMNGKALLYGILITTVTLITGYLLCKCRADYLSALCAVCGGMTSTPALGALMEKHSVDLRIYSFAYIGALLMMVVGISFYWGVGSI